MPVNSAETAFHNPPPTTLMERADNIISRYGGPFESPNFKERGVPGIWGSRTNPLTAMDERRDRNGTIYLAQQWPTLATVLIHEDRYGIRRVPHNFDLQRPFIEKFNEHLSFEGETDNQNAPWAKQVLDYMEAIYAMEKSDSGITVSMEKPSPIAKMAQRLINRFTNHKVIVLGRNLSIHRRG